MKISELHLGLSSREADDLKEVLELVKDLKNRGVTGASVARSFSRQLIQLIKDRVHPAYEYWGQSDPTCEVNRNVVWTSLGPLPWWVLGPTTRWAPGTTRLVPHDT
jgi:hypothetical protein